MPRPRLAMRKVREILRLAQGEGLPLRQVGASLGVPFTTVGDHLRRATAGRAGMAAARRPGRRRAGGAAVPEGSGAGAGPAGAGLEPPSTASCGARA